jgi:hypothetical protein
VLLDLRRELEGVRQRLDRAVGRFDVGRRHRVWGLAVCKLSGFMFDGFRFDSMCLGDRLRRDRRRLGWNAGRLTWRPGRLA